MKTVAENIAFVREKIHDAAERAGRDEQEVTLVAVSKTWPVESVLEAMEAGQTVFGENRVQELLDKSAAVPSTAEWHLIGHLQKNKIRKALPACRLLHSVDSLGLAAQVSRIAGEEGRTARVLIQINVAEDQNKFGYTGDGIMEDFAEMLSLPALEIQGLMTIPVFDENPEMSRPHFRRLREWRDRLEDQYGTALPHLSMGMSHDFAVAVEEGATLVRVGSLIFGNRY